MPEYILVAVAWPYVNGEPHLGHVAGNCLPADIFARYHRLVGNHVLMVSGSDMHGTPTALRALQEGVRPEVVAERFHRVHSENYSRLGIAFDLYTTTATENHRRVAQDIFSRLLENGHVFEDTMRMPWCERESRFLSDRFVEGTCPYCRNPGARGDQCDSCGRTLDAADLIDIRCKADGTTPAFRDTKHFFLKLSNFQKSLEEWVERQEHWRPNVRNATLSMLRERLPDRAITRDLDYGVPVPLRGYETKRIYVWFEALIGYLSASMEWSQLQGDPDAWKKWWHNPEARSFYFMGKDNIIFHTIIWPSTLLGYGGAPALNLPYDVPANEFLNVESRKFSKSQSFAVWLPDYLSRYDPDPLRYYLSAVMPETSDSDFTWAGFVSRNNDELVGTFGNFVHRVLSLIARNFDGKVPEPGELDEADRAAVDACATALAEASKNLSARRFRAGLAATMDLAQIGNRYVDQKAPWQTIKNDRQRTATTLWVGMNIVSTLRTICYPFVPFAAERIHQLLAEKGDVLSAGWRRTLPEAGRKLPQPAALFKKLEPSVADEELARLYGTATPART
ncbi:MAG: methionine--tRNA ligase [Chloroflexi bacterium]|nr:methionine--tRNA ligase [Chloroflexota bacterium]